MEVGYQSFLLDSFVIFTLVNYGTVLLSTHVILRYRVFWTLVEKRLVTVGKTKHLLLKVIG